MTVLIMHIRFRVFHTCIFKFTEITYRRAIFRKICSSVSYVLKLILKPFCKCFTRHQISYLKLSCPHLTVSTGKTKTSSLRLNENVWLTSLGNQFRKLKCSPLKLLYLLSFLPPQRLKKLSIFNHWNCDIAYHHPHVLIPWLHIFTQII